MSPAENVNLYVLAARVLRDRFAADGKLEARISGGRETYMTLYLPNGEQAVGTVTVEEQRGAGYYYSSFRSGPVSYRLTARHFKRHSNGRLPRNKRFKNGESLLAAAYEYCRETTPAEKSQAKRSETLLQLSRAFWDKQEQHNQLRKAMANRAMDFLLNPANAAEVPPALREELASLHEAREAMDVASQAAIDYQAENDRLRVLEDSR